MILVLCVTLIHQPTKLCWSIGFINMLVSNMTDAPFTSWDPTGLIILLSCRLNPSLHLCQSSSPSSFLVFLPNLSFNSTKKCLIVMQAAETVAPMQSDTLYLKLHVRAFSRHLYWELSRREQWERMKGWRFGVLLKDTSKGHIVFIGCFGCHGDQTRDLSFSKRAISPIGQSALKWLIIMQERKIQAPTLMIVLEKQVIDWTRPNTHRASGSVHITSEIT